MRCRPVTHVTVTATSVRLTVVLLDLHSSELLSSVSHSSPEIEWTNVLRHVIPRNMVCAKVATADRQARTQKRKVEESSR